MSQVIIDLTEKVKEQKKNIEKKTLTVKELAQVLGVGENKARQLTHVKGFPCVVIGKKRIIPISQLEKWLETSIGGEF